MHVHDDSNPSAAVRRITTVWEDPASSATAVLTLVELLVISATRCASAVRRPAAKTSGSTCDFRLRSHLPSSTGGIMDSGSWVFKANGAHYHTLTRCASGTAYRGTRGTMRERATNHWLREKYPNAGDGSRATGPSHFFIRGCDRCDAPARSVEHPGTSASPCKHRQALS